MQLFKHMEVVLMLAFGIVCAAAALPPAEAGRAAPALTAPEGKDATADGAGNMPMPVVHVVGRRLTSAEKRAHHAIH
jgi:hypothetical protein